MRGFESSPRRSRWNEIIPKIEPRPAVENLTTAELERRAEIIRQLVERVAPWWEQHVAQDGDVSGNAKNRSLKRQLADFVTFIGEQRDLLDQILADAMEQSKYLDRPMIKLMDGNEIYPSAAIEGWGDHWKIPRAIETPDVWSLGWRKKGEALEGTEIHDHFDSEAGVYVYSGRVIETVYTFPQNEWQDNPERLNAKKAERELKMGEAIPVRTPYIHLVRAHPDEPASFTIHGYFPELRGMHMFEEKDGVLVLTDTWNAENEKKEGDDSTGT